MLFFKQSKVKQKALNKYQYVDRLGSGVVLGLHQQNEKHCLMQGNHRDFLNSEK